jgi:hypothetical protein
MAGTTEREVLADLARDKLRKKLPALGMLVARPPHPPVHPEVRPG